MMSLSTGLDVAVGYQPSMPTPLTTGSQMDDNQKALRARIAKTAKDFESSYLSTVFNGLFEGIGPEAPFGGGTGEAAFQSFFSEAVAKQTVRHGGIGLAASVEKDMLRLQGLSPEATHTQTLWRQTPYGKPGP